MNDPYLKIGKPRKDYTSFWFTLAIIGILCIVFSLTGCAPRQLIAGDPINIKLTDPDSALTSECQELVTIPDRELSQEEVEALWKEDRKGFKVCKTKHKGLVKYYKVRDDSIRDNRGR